MLLRMRQLLVKERVAFAKLTDTYDILDPASNRPVGIAREEPPTWSKFLRLIVNKAILPTVVNVYERDGGPLVFSIRKAGFFRHAIPVVMADGRSLGFLRTKFLSFGGGFWVHDASGRRYAEVKGDWKGWNFRFLSTEGEELGVVAKKWAGLAKELFTTADNYAIVIHDRGAADEDTTALLIAAGLAIDVVYKERS